jgi:uncharacterized protein (TIGR02266 family)
METITLQSILADQHSAAPVEDRRRHPRYAMTLAITMFTDDNFYAGFTEDISEGGVFVSTYRILPIGTVVTMSLYLDDAEAPYQIIGTVQWTRGPEALTENEAVFGANNDVRTGVGIRFDEMSVQAIVAIRRFMRARRPEFYV